jgi:hypothetical protein
VLLCVVFFVTYFVHNVSATVSYDRKELLDIRTAITHLIHTNIVLFNESDAKDLLHTRQGPNPRHSHEEETEISVTKVGV